jgi:hypothetical protein
LFRFSISVHFFPSSPSSSATPGSNRGGLCYRGKHRHWSKKSVDFPVDTELEKWRSSLGGDLLPVTRGVFVWRLFLQHSFHGFHVGGGNRGVTLMIWFWLSEQLSFSLIEKKIYFVKYMGEWYQIESNEK